MTTTPINEERLVTIRQAYKIQFGAAKLLDVLLSNRVINIKNMKDLGLAKSDAHARTAAHRLRKFLTTKGITLRSAQWTGYWLDIPSREQIEEELNAYDKAAISSEKSASDADGSDVQEKNRVG